MDESVEDLDVEDRTMKVLFFLSLVFVALLVILTCIWKIVKLIALYKMESRIEELEQSLAGVGGLEGLSSGAAGGLEGARRLIVSPKEARTLRRLSILAGFDKSWTSLGFSRRKSATNSGSSLRSALISSFKKGSSTINILNDSSGVRMNGMSQDDLRSDNAPMLSNVDEINLARFKKSSESLPNGKTAALNETCTAHVHYQNPHEIHHHLTHSKYLPSPPLDHGSSPVGDSTRSPNRIKSTSFSTCAIHGHRPPPAMEPQQPSQVHPPSPLSSSWSPDDEETSSPGLDGPPPPLSEGRTPPSPHWVECRNPYHVHPRPMIVPKHIHQCHCGASFPSLDSLGASCIQSGSVIPSSHLGSCWQRRNSSSQPNITDHPSSGEDPHLGSTSPRPTRVSTSSSNHRRSLPFPDFDNIEAFGLQEPLYSQLKKALSNSWTCAQNGSRSNPITE